MPSLKKPTTFVFWNMVAEVDGDDQKDGTHKTQVEKDDAWLVNRSASTITLGGFCKDKTAKEIKAKVKKTDSSRP